MNSLFELQNIKTPPVWKERLNGKVSQGKSLREPTYRKFPVMAAVLMIVLLMSGTALAYALTGGEFFAKLFMQKAETNSADYSYIDVSQLSAIAGKTIGTVVDTDQLRIDVTDVVSSGSDAMVALCVTAKQLDSVLRYTGWDEVPLNNYRFGSEDGTIFNNMESATVRYIYSDEDTSLAPNQFYLVLTITSLDGFKDSPYTVALQSFGYYDRLAATGNGVGVTTLYKGPWKINLDLSQDTDHSRTILLNRKVDIGEYNYDLEGIYLTPFSCTAVISYEGDPDLSEERFKEVSVKASDFALYTTDRTPVKHGEVSLQNGGTDQPDSTYHITVHLEVPANVKDVLRIHIFGKNFDISPVINDAGQK